MNAPCIRTTADLALVDRVIAARRARCIGESIRTPILRESTKAPTTKGARS